MYYAFNMMRRVGKNSILYESFRKEFSELVSKRQMGIKMSEENKKLMSERNKGFASVTDGIYNFKVKVDDPRLLSGEIWSSSIGRIHSDETKQKIGKGLRGKKCYTNGVSDIFLAESEEIPNDYYMGTIQKGAVKTSENRTWCYNIITGENIRISKNAELPEGYKFGRNTDIGFSVLNSVIRVYSFSDKKVYIYEKDAIIDLPKYTYMRLVESKSGKKNIDGLKVFYEYNGYIASSYPTIRKMLINNGISFDKNKQKEITINDIDITKHKIITVLDTYDIG